MFLDVRPDRIVSIVAQLPPCRLRCHKRPQRTATNTTAIKTIARAASIRTHLLCNRGANSGARFQTQLASQRNPTGGA